MIFASARTKEDLKKLIDKFYCGPTTTIREDGRLETAGGTVLVTSVWKKKDRWVFGVKENDSI